MIIFLIKTWNLNYKWFNENINYFLIKYFSYNYSHFLWVIKIKLIQTNYFNFWNNPIEIFSATSDNKNFKVINLKKK